MAKTKIQRSSRIYLNAVNASKKRECFAFLNHCHDLQQYFVDLFWQRQDCSGKFTDLETVHRGRDRFKATTRLAQAMAKQAKEQLRHKNGGIRKRKPRLRQQTATLYYHFSNIEKAECGFDYVLNLIGSGAPKLTIPFNSTAHLNRLIANGFTISKTVRIGRDKQNLWLDVIVEKTRPQKRANGKVIGVDSNYKGGFVFSDGRLIAKNSYNKIQQFAKREKNTHEQIKQELNRELKHFDFSDIKLIAVEDLKCVKHHKRGTFSRIFNRRLSHWTYRYFMVRLEQICEEQGIAVSRKLPHYTSQTCHSCHRCDKRNRAGSEFVCVWCGHHDSADLNAARNLCLLGEAELYGIRSLPSWKYMGVSLS